MNDADTLQRFLFENSDVRGTFIHLQASFIAACNRYDYPGQVAQQLGQALAASTLLSSTIKFKGSLIFQVQSNGPINMLVAQCDDQQHIRGLARWQDEINGDSLTDIFGEGRITITINSERNEDRYQGVVGLEGTSLNEAIESYFRQSEQLDTRLWLFADHQQAVGLLLQRLPGESPDENFWHHIETLGETLTSSELLQLSSTDILHRLFHEEDIRLFEPEPVSFRCSCSLEKITTMIRALGYDEAHSIIEEQGKIEVGCEFCNQQYIFDQVDTEALFASHIPPPTTGTKQ